MRVSFDFVMFRASHGLCLASLRRKQSERENMSAHLPKSPTALLYGGNYYIEGSEGVKTQIYFPQIHPLMAMNSHTCLSGVPLDDKHLTGHTSHRICISLGVYLPERAS